MPYTINDGLRIHYEVVGSGEPLVLYHGLTGSGERWRDTGYVAGLADAYRLILIDARGHGESDKPHDQEAYGRHRQAADVGAVLNDLEMESARFWGHSMGGDVALTLGRHHPDRVSALVVTGYSPFAAAGDESAEMAAWATYLQAGIEGFVTGHERRHGILPDEARARWLANDGAALAACVASMIAESDGSQVTDLPAIETPVMLLVGTKESFAEHARAAANLLPRGMFVPLDGLDHVSVFPNSEITEVSHYGEAGPMAAGSVMVVSFRLDGQGFAALNGGPEFTFNEAVSFLIDCQSQEEVDYYWDTLTDGGEPGPCGWLKDKFGVSWQVNPTVLTEMLQDEDRERADRVMQAMLQMGKIDIAKLEEAYAQK